MESATDRKEGTMTEGLKAVRHEAGQENLYCSHCRAEYDPFSTYCTFGGRRLNRRHVWSPVRLDALIAEIANEGQLPSVPNAWGGLDLWATSLRLVPDDGAVDVICFDGSPDHGVIAWKAHFGGGTPTPVIVAALVEVIEMGGRS